MAGEVFPEGVLARFLAFENKWSGEKGALRCAWRAPRLTGAIYGDDGRIRCPAEREKLIRYS